MLKSEFKELLLFGFSNIAAGMFFGTGYIIVEHTSNSWFPSESTAQPETNSPQTASTTIFLSLEQIFM